MLFNEDMLIYEYTEERLFCETRNNPLLCTDDGKEIKLKEKEEFECPYCGETCPSQRELRRHVGGEHRDRVDDFLLTYRGGRIIPQVERGGIVILGAGVAGLKVALNLDRSLPSPKRITLIDRNDYHQYLHHLQKVCNVDFEENEIVIPLSRLIGETKIKFLETIANSINPEKKIVYTQDGAISFDVLVIALGSEVSYFGIEGAKENSLVLDSYSGAKKIRTKILKAFEEAEGTRKPPKIVIGGAGMTGVELAGELAEWYPFICHAFNLDYQHRTLTLVELTGSILPGWDKTLALKGQKGLEELGVEMIFNDGIMKVSKNEVCLSSGTKIPYDLFIWTCGVKGNEVATKGFNLGGGRILVDDYCRAEGYEGIYVAGDCAHVVNKDGESMSPSAHIAMEHAEVISHNIKASFGGGDMKKYEFSRIGEIVTIGKGFALADLYGFKFSGFPAKFMKKAVHWWYIKSIGGK